MLKRKGFMGFAMVLSICFASQVMGQQSGLGSHWPNAADVSSSPNWHVYVFSQSGVKYIQVNDLSGNVREVVANAGDQFLVLPMGADMQRATTPQDDSTPKLALQSGVVMAASCEPPECVNVTPTPTVAAKANLLPTQLVYRDDTVAVTVAMDADGHLHWNNQLYKSAAVSKCQPPECVGVRSPQ